MALTKETTEDYEVRGEFKTIQKRTRTAIMEDGAEISYKSIIRSKQRLINKQGVKHG